MKTFPSKWGDDIAGWCARNGLDATRIPDRPDSIVTTTDHAGTITARVRLAGLEAPTGGRVLSRSTEGHDLGETLVELVVDSEPPVNPEWSTAIGAVGPSR